MASTYSIKQPDMSRRTDLAGRTVSSNGMNVTYDSNGYAVSAINYNHPVFAGTDRGVAAPSVDRYNDTGGVRGGYGGSSYDQQYMSTRDLQNAAFVRQQAQNGLMSWADANAAVEGIRARYGYAGGGNGAGYTKLGTIAFDPDDVTTQPLSQYFGGQPATVRQTVNYGLGGNAGYSYGQPVYTNRHQNEIDALSQAILSRDPFSYDLDSDPLYGYYESAYQRNGEKAMKNTLGQVAARTGGMASSWAGTQAQQSYNDYVAGLNDIVPELYQLAYNMYRDDADYQRENLSMLQSLEQGDYNRFLNALSQWNADRDYDYNAYRDAIADSRYANEIAYARSRDALSDSRYDDETAYSRLMAAAQLGASYGDYGGLGSLGITPNLANVANYTAAGSAAVQNSNRSGTSKSTSTSGGSDGGTTWQDVEDYVAIGGDAEDFIKANYKALGYSSQSAAVSAWKVVQTQNGAGKQIETPTNTPSASNGGYGTSFTNIWKNVRNMYDGTTTKTKSMTAAQREAAISEYLDRFDETQLTDAGLAYIMKSINLGGYREG